MKDILFSAIGFWSAFTILFILAGMTYFVVKMVQLSGDKEKQAELTSSDD